MSDATSRIDGSVELAHYSWMGVIFFLSYSTWSYKKLEAATTRAKMENGWTI